MESDRLSYEEKEELPDSVFGLPERREYPMPDAAHVRAAEAYNAKSHFSSLAYYIYVRASA